MTISEALTEFLAEQKARLGPKTYRDKERIVGLLRRSLDCYGYQSLSPDERRLWEERWKADEDTGSFCNCFGPEKILDHVGEFLGYSWSAR